VDTVIIDGKIVMENREILTIDEEEVKKEAAKLVKKLLG
jgi:5-methylthioadenosine/S-adenosylhomocysteine deaminase